MTTLTPPAETWYEHNTEPFTDAERLALGEYESGTSGIPDTFDIVDFTSTEADDSTEAEVKDMIRSYFGMLESWYDSLDRLRSDLSRADGILSVAATQYITEQANRWYHLLNLTRREACKWAFGTAGPQPEVDAGHLTFFAIPGIQLDGTIAAESQ